MNAEQCRQKLIDALRLDLQADRSIDIATYPASVYSNRELHTCTTTLGGKDEMSAIIRDVYQQMRREEVHGAAPEETATTAVQETPPTGVEQRRSQTALPFMQNVGYALLLVGVLYAFFVFITWVIRILFDVFNAKRLVYMKILLPRGDSKVDRDLAKELAKDMKEKISRMSQVYRNLHSIGELSAADSISNFFFHRAKITLMMHFENGNLGFYLATYPEYMQTVKAAISAQYAEASIETVEPIEMRKHPYVDCIPLEYTKKSFYPLRTFKELEDDPINNLIDAIANVSSEDTFTMMLALKPEGKKFNNKAQKVADSLYRRQDKYKTPHALWRRIFFFPRYLLQALFTGDTSGLKGTDAPGATGGDSYVRMVKAEEEALNSMGEEAGKPAFAAGLFLLSTSKNKHRVHENIRNVVSSFTIYTDEYNNSLDHPEKFADILGFWFNPLWLMSIKFHLTGIFSKKNIFSVNELSSIFHLPDGIYNRSSTINRMDYKMLNSPSNAPQLKEPNGFVIDGIIAEQYKGGVVNDILAGQKNDNIGMTPEGKPGLKLYKDGILLGLNVYRNKYTPIYMKRNDRTRHHYIIGKSGGGKSVYIDFLARQDIWNGDGVCVIDPHGDLVESILGYIPKERAKDVIYFDAGNEDRPMGMNLYEIKTINEADRVVNDATETFIKMFGPEIFGPRIQEYFKYGSLTLLDDMEDPATLLDVPRLFTDEIYREYKSKRVKNPVVRNFWEKTYNAMGDREKQEIIPYFTSKFVSFNTNSLIRNIIGQTKSAFNFRDVMDNQKILLINLSKGKIGELNAQLLGMIIVSKIYNAAMGRADTAQDKRKDFYLYVDEFQNFVTDTFADILSEARKYRLGLIMAHQFIAQLEGENGNDSVKDAVFGNVGTMQSFKVGAPDAEFLEKEYAPVLGAQDILGIANYKTYTKLNINNSTSRPFSLNSIYTTSYYNPKAADILKTYSATKYGRKREYVNAEIEARLGMGDEEEEETQQTPDMMGTPAGSTDNCSPGISVGTKKVPVSQALDAQGKPVKPSA